MPQVSVIIPCYNHGAYVDEAVQSVLVQTYPDFEIIIVNDGSTDEATNRILETYTQPKTQVLQTSNQGLAQARNNGIAAARGEYILPLDADDRIGRTYLEKAIGVLQRQATVGIVYCKAEFFGEQTGEWGLPPYSLEGMLTSNMIFCSALYRRTDWELVGGYNNGMPAWEDYDLWLSLIGLGRGVYQIPEVLFYYRQRQGSMLRSMGPQDHIEGHKRMFQRHRLLYEDNIHVLFTEIQQLRRQNYELQEVLANTKIRQLRKLGGKVKRAFITKAKPSDPTAA